MRTACILIALLPLLGIWQPAVAAGEEFSLADGGQVSGELLNPNQIPRTDYVVRTAEGVVFKIDNSQVAKVEQRRPEVAEYERIWPSFADTVDDQWKIAEWCRENALVAERESHLNRILQLDPEHEEARRVLGFMRRNGRWITRDQLYQRRCYVEFEGQWRTVQEVQLIEEERAGTRVHNDWIRQIKTYRDQLASGNGAAEARRALLSISDPGAIGALGKALEDESNPKRRELLLDALGNIGTDPAAMVLAVAYTKEPVEDLRYTCLDHLKGKHIAVEYFVGLLNSKDNAVVNGAAFALGYLEDPSAVGPLIRSLVTVHKVRIKQGDPNQTNAGFDNRGNAGFSAGGSDRIVSVPAQNRAVLDALVKLTGQSYGFNIDQWKAWHANQRRYEQINARRD